MSAPTRSPRSYLFVPGNRPERFDKACAAGADAVILDLEDSVAPADKPAARAAVKAWLSPARAVLLRVNGCATEWFDADLTLAAVPGVAGIVLPRAERVEDIQRVAQRAGMVKPILPLIESARGFDQARELVRAPQVERLLFGTLDFMLDLGVHGNGDELLVFRSQLVLVSRLAGIGAPVDGITIAIDDGDALRAASRRARSLGFGAKLCIHPKQVAIVNECFTPSAEEIAWARRVVAAAASAEGAAVAVDGQMVDRPVLRRARELLAAAGE